MTVTSNGTYRIYAHDDANSSGVRALKIVKNSGTNYWVEFRQRYTNSKWSMNGAGLRWGGNGNERSQLLDTTPGSFDSYTDSGIVIGRTFSDLQSGIHITAVGKGGTSPESLDLVVNLGGFPLNADPTVTITAPVTNAATGVALSFSAAAADANGDALAYYWDFGDGNFGTNGPAASKSWSVAGEYVVRCLVTDMKGGLASDSVIVRIGSPAISYRISGRVTLNSNPLVNTRVYVSSSKMAFTDSDGTYDIVGVAAGTYTVTASLFGYTFKASAFTNPITLATNATNIDFLATLSVTNAPAITSQPGSQTVRLGGRVALSSIVTGSAPLKFQWRKDSLLLTNGGNVSGTATPDFTITNVQYTQAGSYTLVVTNQAGSVTSAPALLSVVVPLPIVLLSSRIISNRQFQATLSGSTGDIYSMETSTNLKTWAQQSSLTNTTGSVRYIDSGASNVPSRFYRALLKP